MLVPPEAPVIARKSKKKRKYIYIEKSINGRLPTIQYYIFLGEISLLIVKLLLESCCFYRYPGAVGVEEDSAVDVGREEAGAGEGRGHRHAGHQQAPRHLTTKRKKDSFFSLVGKRLEKLKRNLISTLFV